MDKRQVLEIARDSSAMSDAAITGGVDEADAGGQLVVVGSKNPVKIAAVKGAFTAVWPSISWTFQGLDVASGVRKFSSDVNECLWPHSDAEQCSNHLHPRDTLRPCRVHTAPSLLSRWKTLRVIVHAALNRNSGHGAVGSTTDR
jgi:hypothetical protein